jgi:hypothetical protein
LGQCPSRVLMRGRMGQEVVFGDGSTYWHNLGGARDVYEPLSRTRRPAVVQDVVNSARVLDALPNATTVTPSLPKCSGGNVWRCTGTRSPIQASRCTDLDYRPQKRSACWLRWLLLSAHLASTLRWASHQSARYTSRIT